MTRLGLIVTAAGSSTRFGTDKLFIDQSGQPLIAKTLLCFKNTPISEAIITYNPSQKIKMEDVIKTLSLPFPISFIEGGKTRKESVKNAVYALKNCDNVLIHDGARPNVTQELIDRILNAGKNHKAVIPGLSITDTVKWVENNTVIKTVDRHFLIRVQTPQYFDCEILKKAYGASSEDVTDEAMLLESLGEKITVVEGDSDNIKITFPNDLKVLLI